MPELLGRLQSALADRYRLDREAGAGGMATVYLAQDIRHDRRVAVKVLRPELAAVIGAERFLAEIKLTANLQHPHILPLFDSGEADGYLFYVMPYVEGETLRDRLNREKQLPVADAVRITTEVAAALDYAHRHGVIHRDIKPENILLHDGQALVADFGIALAASKAGESRMTETGMSLGTPHYMSPEQAMGEREITARSDVYTEPRKARRVRHKECTADTCEIMRVRLRIGVLARPRGLREKPAGGRSPSGHLREDRRPHPLLRPEKLSRADARALARAGGDSQL
jgi:serine/threonine protein kinase